MVEGCYGSGVEGQGQEGGGEDVLVCEDYGGFGAFFDAVGGQALLEVVDVVGKGVVGGSSFEGWSQFRSVFLELMVFVVVVVSLRSGEQERGLL